MPKFVHARMPATGRVELLHPMTVEALGLEVVDPDAPADKPAPPAPPVQPRAVVPNPGPAAPQPDPASK